MNARNRKFIAELRFKINALVAALLLDTPAHARPTVVDGTLAGECAIIQSDYSKTEKHWYELAYGLGVCRRAVLDLSQNTSQKKTGIDS